MSKYHQHQPVLIAVDCIIFGFDGNDLKVLLIKRGFEPEKNKWSLMGGFLNAQENLDEAASRILLQLTGLKGVYLEQLKTFSKINRDPEERTISVAYFALVDINKYQQQLSEEYHAEWFLLNNRPQLIFDHEEMVDLAQKQLRYKATQRPILFELLPEKFTLSQVQHLYEGVYNTVFDQGNFARKLLSTRLILKQNTKDKSSSKKGAFHYKIDKRKYKLKQGAFLNFVSKADREL
jgi:ADP-ribose pyrophosphatase YjhB (NUDIX family)